MLQFYQLSVTIIKNGVIFIKTSINTKKLRGNILLLITALIWGTTFVAQSEGTAHIGPFTFNCMRSLISFIVLIPVVLIMNKSDKKDSLALKSKFTKTLLLGGISCGAAMFIGSTFQQTGISYTTAGKAGFITALYIVIVPLTGIFFKKKVPVFVWISVVIAVAGMYLLCIKEGFAIGKGDLLVFFCALGFTAHILVIDYFSNKADCVMMSCIQFLMNGILSGIMMLIFEKPDISSIIQCAFPILYAGLLSGAIGYTLQIVAQKDTDPTVASLLMSLESVFAALSGWLILHEVLTLKEFIGCMLIFAAVILAQIPQPNKKT